MSKKFIKVYFNNGCTTLLYNESTTVEDMIRLAIKGRLSLIELRYKNCFKIRATKYLVNNRDKDNLNSPSSSSSSSNNQIDINDSVEEHYWLKNNLTVKDWLKSVDREDVWKLHLRIRFLPSDLNEVKFKDPITFNYFYEQIKNDYIQNIAPTITDINLVQKLFELGCLEIRRSFQNMNPNSLDKKINYDYLENDFGLRKFFPEMVLHQKAKNIKKSIIKGIKAYENLNEIDCMLKFFDILYDVWKFNEENFNCVLGCTWDVPISVNISYDNGISGLINDSQAFQNTKFEDIQSIYTELDVNKRDSLIKLKIAESKEFLTFKFDNMRQAENMASLIDGYCQLKAKKNISLWLTNSKNLDDGSLLVNTNILKRDEKNMIRSSILDVNEIKNITSPASTDDVSIKEIPFECLVFQEKLGSGQFGDVFKGTYQKNSSQAIEVAIKKLKINNLIDMDPNEQAMIAKKFMKEAKIMANFDHQHIIKLIGIYYDDTLSIVMELAKFGQLKSYLQANKDHIETSTLIIYCYQLNSAMAYLETKKFVHRDIAARNVLVFNHECVKLADFGLSREIDENAYLGSKTKLPIKWLAPESINFRRFTSQSDVWMFGVCMWEILTYGLKPFQGIKNPDVIKLIEEKKRLDQPENCPDELYILLLRCWEYDATKRITFSQLKEELFNISKNLNEIKSNKSIMPQSLSNGSSFLSNSSASSNLSSSNNLSLTNTELIGNTCLKFPVSKTTSLEIPTNSNLTRSHSPSPPPKPNRFNSNTLNPKKGNLIMFDDYSAVNNDGNFKLVKGISDSSSMSNKFINFNDDSIKYSYRDSPNIENLSSPYKKMIQDSELTFSTLKDGPSSKKNFYHNLLDEKIKEMDLNKTSTMKSDSINKTESPATPSRLLNKNNYEISPTQSIKSISSVNKDIILRDQTLKFIQNISIFIKYLHSDEKPKLDNELKAIMLSLKTLIQLIESIDVTNQSTEINILVNKLDRYLNFMINELRKNEIDCVVNSALTMARTANDLFLLITKSSA